MEIEQYGDALAWARRGLDLPAAWQSRPLFDLAAASTLSAASWLTCSPYESEGWPASPISRAMRRCARPRSGPARGPMYASGPGPPRQAIRARPRRGAGE
jgi:hypothetical protein